MSVGVGQHLKDLVSLGLYGPVRPLLCRLPRGRLDRLAGLGAQAGTWMDPARNTLAREELRRSFGDLPLPRDEEAILRDAWRLAVFNELEVLRYGDLTPARMEEICQVEGLEHLEKARSDGVGAIVLIGHLGANQMIMPALGHKGFPMNQLSAPPTVWAEIHRGSRTTAAYSRVLARRWELEQKLPVRHINVFRFLRPALECLERSEVLGLAFDGGGGKRWTQVELLGRTANVAVQPVQLARRAGARILPTRVWRSPEDLRHRIEIHSPLEVAAKGELGDQETMQALADRFTPWIRERPEQYLHFLVVRRRMATMDVQPFFVDYPGLENRPGAQEAEAFLREAAERAGVGSDP